MSQRTLKTTVERWPLAEAFTISRGSRSEAVVVVATVSDGQYEGRGECVPYARYGETIEGVVADIEAQSGALRENISRTILQDIMPAGAARNAVDCALWDLEAKANGTSAAARAQLAPLSPVTTAYTISLAPAEIMARKAAEQGTAYPLLKLKLGGEGDAQRLRAVRAAAPDARLIVDANEAWNLDELNALLAVAAETGVELIEQPLPAGEDEALNQVTRTVPLCADESCHGIRDLDRIASYYDAINIKLDKTGGLTGALKLAQEARNRNLGIMTGCMVATSLAMAPALLIAQMADWVDLDGPLLLARDRTPGLRYCGATIAPPEPDLWG